MKVRQPARERRFTWGIPKDDGLVVQTDNGAEFQSRCLRRVRSAVHNPRARDVAQVLRVEDYGTRCGRGDCVLDAATELPAWLIDKIRSRRAVVMAGSGVSAGPPSSLPGRYRRQPADRDGAGRTPRALPGTAELHRQHPRGNRRAPFKGCVPAGLSGPDYRRAQRRRLLPGAAMRRWDDAQQRPRRHREPRQTRRSRGDRHHQLRSAHRTGAHCARHPFPGRIRARDLRTRFTTGRRSGRRAASGGESSRERA